MEILDNQELNNYFRANPKILFLLSIMLTCNEAPMSNSDINKVMSLMKENRGKGAFTAQFEGSEAINYMFHRLQKIIFGNNSL